MIKQTKKYYDVLKNQSKIITLQGIDDFLKDKLVEISELNHKLYGSYEKMNQTVENKYSMYKDNILHIQPWKKQIPYLTDYKVDKNIET